jgi:hypothetical protein
MEKGSFKSLPDLVSLAKMPSPVVAGIIKSLQVSLDSPLQETKDNSVEEIK